MIRFEVNSIADYRFVTGLNVWVVLVVLSTRTFVGNNIALAATTTKLVTILVVSELSMALTCRSMTLLLFVPPLIMPPRVKKTTYGVTAALTAVIMSDMQSGLPRTPGMIRLIVILF